MRLKRDLPLVGLLVAALLLLHGALVEPPAHDRALRSADPELR
eukprot:CAMPEP_0119290300 /NCGR_PEP_ID=MMETSP1329-20130426/40474_1 /TAXON_ID=114041 /ORGANISM="Genus nov. species nov., Strain RCC1024" /LENGTH=42 /DNA_ID= /DNA_START= /DNA_END= /DNA_ORIENTATION=